MDFFLAGINTIKHIFNNLLQNLQNNERIKNIIYNINSKIFFIPTANN
jgi:hypothetical protein